ncbi:hypothetical protein CBR71_00220 [Bordetella hinzii]|nr:hypothetical protein CBR68_00225 [Bordetella hinzii]QDJ39838.1 hypothetical protein CBR70_00220 [Bordetella hinzii]QDJ44358.1 hypothetical protein CBR71_00220 [Bordetella hinzii]QDJ53371.1 hypothetical protein CBR72_00230 [Bordetella hinzii]
MHLHYQNAAMSTDAPANYHVSPLALIERGSVLYLVSCCRSRGNGDISRYLHQVDHIVKALVTQDPADADENFDLERFLRHEHNLLFSRNLPSASH